MKTPWRISAKASGTLQLYIYDEIGESLFSDEGVTAQRLAADLAAAGNVHDILVRVNSPGGSVFEGLAIFNGLVSHGARIRAQVDGLAASIASVIVMAAAPGQIAMHENALFMIHNPWASAAGGDADKLRKLASTLDTVKANMVRAYGRHSTLDPEDISQLMQDETWLDAPTAIEKGFADTIINTCDDVDVAASFDLARFHHVPAAIMAKARQRPPAPTAVITWDEEQERRRLELQLELLRRL